MEIPRLRANRIEKAYQLMEKAMSKALNDEDINYYEMGVALAMLDANVKTQNVASYIQQEVTKLDRELNNKMRFYKSGEDKAV